MPRRRNEYRQRLRPRVNDVQQPAPQEEPAPEEEPVPEVVQVVNRGRHGNRRRAAPEHQQPDQPVENINQPPPQKQLKTTAVQAGPGNTLINTGPLLMPCANEVDIIVSQQIKEKIWNFEFVDFGNLLKQNSQYYSNVDQKQSVTVENGMLVISNKPSKVNTINNIELWTEAFANFSKILLQKHASLAQDLFTYMSIIRDAISDAPFDRVYQYDRQFRLRLSLNHSKSWSEIDGFLWLKFIAKGSQGTPNPVVYQANLQKPCYDFNFKGFCQKYPCFYRHNCMKCSLQHPALSCVRFDRLQGNQGFGSLRPPMFNQNRPQMSNQFRQNRPSFVQQNRYRPPFNTRYSVPRFNQMN
ncbi:Hypothetical predicted protein [Mytilus galloprovincialis]|uniref:C3H1-type domain-containing protein n=1 Tax=Mytilus galloprovincialis TaxID=29158 RepID=A0A8B6DJH1_MYTGA|nr:Hypothetical predicted protein [Mytilus galloprovincialis]